MGIGLRVSSSGAMRGELEEGEMEDGDRGDGSSGGGRGIRERSGQGIEWEASPGVRVRIRWAWRSAQWGGRRLGLRRLRACWFTLPLSLSLKSLFPLKNKTEKEKEKKEKLGMESGHGDNFHGLVKIFMV